MGIEARLRTNHPLRCHRWSAALLALTGTRQSSFPLRAPRPAWRQAPPEL